MANRYWVGGTASWDGTAGTKWALTSGGAGGQAIPTSADDVFFDAASGANTVTIATGNTGAKSITCTGFTGTLTGTAAITVSGSITLVAGMTYSHTGTVTFNATATLTTAGKTFSGVTINGSGITVSLGDALNISTRTLTVTQGTFTTTASNYAITAGSLSSSGTSTRTVALNSSTVTLSSTATALSMSTVTNLTFTGSGCTVNLSGAGPTLTVGSTVTIPGTVAFTGTAGDSNYKSGASISLGSTFTNLTFNGPTASSTGIVSCSLAGNITVTGTLTCASTNPWGRVFLYSSTQGTARTITAAAVSLTDVDFQDITGAGAASWTGTRLGNAQGNSGITFPGTKTVYWSTTSSGRYGSANWATSIGGGGSSANFPLPQDTANFPTSYPSSGQTITQDIYNYGTVDSSAKTSNTITFTSSGPDTYGAFGNLIYGTGATQSGTMRWQFSNRTSQTFTPATGTMTSAITVDSLTGTITLNGNLTVSGSSLALVSGTFDCNGYNVTLTSTGSFSTTGTLTRTMALGSGTFSFPNNWQVASTTNLTISGTGTIKTTATGAAFNGGGYAYTNITLDKSTAGSITITGNNTFKDITNSYGSTGASTITFAAGSTQTLTNFTATGTAGNVLTINSDTPGSQATLSKASGAVSVSYLSITDSNATGGATWTALNSTDAGNNTGWTFTAAASGNFFFLMGA